MRKCLNRLFLNHRLKAFNGRQSVEGEIRPTPMVGWR